MAYLVISILILSIWDIKEMKKKNQRKDIIIYIFLMLVVGAVGAFYLSDPQRESFSEKLLSLIGR